MSGLRTECLAPCNSKSLTWIGRDSSLVKGVEVERDMAGEGGGGHSGPMG